MRLPRLSSTAAVGLALAAALASAEAQAQALAPQGFETPQTITPPRLAVDSPAAYPDEALKARFREVATVVLVLEVDGTGAVTETRVDAPAGHGFDQAAVAAARKLRFEPATQGNSPVAARIRFRYVFRPPPPRLSGRSASRVTDAGLTA
jgi:TonB family protein